MTTKYGNPHTDEIKKLLLQITQNDTPEHFFSSAEDQLKLPSYVKYYITDSIIRRLYQFICHAPEAADMVEFIPETKKKDIVLHCIASSLFLDILPHFYDHTDHKKADEIITSFLSDSKVSPLFDSDLSSFIKNLIDNTCTALTKTFGITKTDIKKLLDDVKKYVKHNKKPDFDFSFNLLDNYQYVNVNAQVLNFIYKSFTKDFIYLTQDVSKFYDEINTIVPNCAAFINPWLKGFVHVAQNKLKDAQKNYKEAFKHITYAGDYIAVFLHQYFALFMYTDNIEEACEAWNYGFAAGLNGQATQDFIDSYNPKEQFYVQFPLAMFVDKDEAYKTAVLNYTKKSEDKIKQAINTGNAAELESLINTIDINTYTIDNVTPLYYALQRKNTQVNGSEAYADKIVETQTALMIKQLNFNSMTKNQQQGVAMSVHAQMNLTYKKSGLAKAMFEAEFSNFKLDDVIDLLIKHTDNPDNFVYKLSGKMGATPLYLSAETDDVKTAQALINKGADPQLLLGTAPFGLKYKDGKNIYTELPNTFIYRLINFKSFKTLKMYLSEYAAENHQQMTQKSEKSNITPLVYFILNMLYTARTKQEYDSNAKIVDEFLPLFIQSGSVLTEQTAFGTAKELLGM